MLDFSIKELRKKKKMVVADISDRKRGEKLAYVTANANPVSAQTPFQTFSMECLLKFRR